MTDSLKRPLPRLIWWILFIAATYAMSLWFQTFKAFMASPIASNMLNWLGVNALLIVLMALMIYDSYVHEKSRGKVQKPLRFFEWLLKKRFLLRGDLT